MNIVEIKYWKVKARMVLLVLILFVVFNSMLGSFGYNLVDMFSNKISSIVGKNLHLNKIFFLIVFFAGVIIALNRTTWLPFLGWTALPGSLVPLKENKGDITVTVNTQPNTRVAYWSAIAQKDTPVPTVLSAYKNFSNSGVVTSDNNGVALLTLQSGTDYVVPSGKTIKRHVHYRTLDHEYGMIGPVMTAYY